MSHLSDGGTYTTPLVPGTVCSGPWAAVAALMAALLVASPSRTTLGCTRQMSRTSAANLAASWTEVGARKSKATFTQGRRLRTCRENRAAEGLT